MIQMTLLTQKPMTPAKGVVWGAAGFCAFFVAPAIGLPPEIPGIEAAPIGDRQSWWLVAVAGVGCGLLVLFHAPIKFKLLGVVMIVIPYLFEVPHLSGPAFKHEDGAVVEALTHLHQQFIVGSAAANLGFWLVLGGLCTWLSMPKILAAVEDITVAEQENA